VLLQAEIGGEVRCLMELISSAPDGFQELDCLRPLRCALLEGEDWRQACQRLLQELFALEPAWQGRQLRLEEVIRTRQVPVQQGPRGLATTLALSNIFVLSLEPLPS
ncbi:unnamed protein product, partial [Prorocentrum cordatum]